MALVLDDGPLYYLNARLLEMWAALGWVAPSPRAGGELVLTADGESALVGFTEGRWIGLDAYPDLASAQMEAEQHAEHYGGETIVTERRVAWFSGSGAYLSRAGASEQD